MPDKTNTCLKQNFFEPLQFCFVCFTIANFIQQYYTLNFLKQNRSVNELFTFKMIDSIANRSVFTGFTEQSAVRSVKTDSLGTVTNFVLKRLLHRHVNL